jgi:hypothetical protein
MRHISRVSGGPPDPTAGASKMNRHDQDDRDHTRAMTVATAPSNRPRGPDARCRAHVTSPLNDLRAVAFNGGAEHENLGHDIPSRECSHGCSGLTETGPIRPKHPDDIPHAKKGLDQQCNGTGRTGGNPRQNVAGWVYLPQQESTSDAVAVHQRPGRLFRPRPSFSEPGACWHAECFNPSICEVKNEFSAEARNC